MIEPLSLPACNNHVYTPYIICILVIMVLVCVHVIINVFPARLPDVCVTKSQEA